MHLFIVDREGQEHRVEALEGWRAMEVIRDWGIPITAECGGACSCGTCHVYVNDIWAERLLPPSDEETERLDSAWAVESNSRLACQILMTPELDGLRITLAPTTE